MPAASCYFLVTLPVPPQRHTANRSAKNTFGQRPNCFFASAVPCAPAPGLQRSDFVTLCLFATGGFPPSRVQNKVCFAVFWFFALAPVHPPCSQRLRASVLLQVEESVLAQVLRHVALVAAKPAPLGTPRYGHPSIRSLASPLPQPARFAGPGRGTPELGDI